ncbi:MAG: SDR family oxidoreductase [Pseudomonadales bacterium]|jgi:3-oxoacyl-[acyl-carrier protein] reductase|nr:SDR family oxidoreductase [Pseudomonadales bacterium]MDP6469718.1 SDR family oxidoreductase [Pseudomonadales bacterium]MDP6827681.1 SDR family oxidoreductase [Pseudomonadales bacterium]MDP6971879.1 SDR family oxidoreductase [Pseudomonadales bacterium]|tara:strand:- start:202 stop:1005 length:804 start_codon:yes stop_codon:yes gene_type:complete
MSELAPENLLDLSSRVALVTGAGQGVGATTAHYLATQGAAVVVNDYVAERAETVAGEINESGGTAIALQGDVTSFEAVTAMLTTAREQLGTVDVLVNNAGNAGANPLNLTGAPFWEKDPAEWEPFLQVNLYGVLNCCRAVIPAMLEAGNGGRLITVISDAGRVGEPGLEAYSAAKAGAAGLMRALARSLGRFNVTSNCVAIATTRTPAVEAMTSNEDLLRRMLTNYIIRRVGEPSDVAAMVTFLASNAASWTTGQTYPVNGGFSVNL